MIINFSEKLESVQNGKLKKAIVCQCARDSFIAVTQEINSILIILKNEGITPSEFVEFVENDADQITARLLQRLADIQGGNLVSMSKKLEEDLSKQPQLTEGESKILAKKQREIGADYFIDNETIISQKLNKHIVELLEMDSI